MKDNLKINNKISLVKSQIVFSYSQTTSLKIIIYAYVLAYGVIGMYMVQKISTKIASKITKYNKLNNLCNFNGKFFIL